LNPFAESFYIFIFSLHDLSCHLSLQTQFASSHCELRSPPLNCKISASPPFLSSTAC